MRYLHLMLVSLVVFLIWSGPDHAMRATSARNGMSRTSPEISHPETSPHPIVGVWRWDKDPAHPNTHISYGVFNADGTYEEITTGAGTAVGMWQATGERTVEVTFVFQDLSEDPAIVDPGIRKIWMRADVKPTGFVVTASYNSDTQTLDGRDLGHRGPFPAQGARVTVDPVVPFEMTEQGLLAS
jgi:hypothetical protein